MPGLWSGRSPRFQGEGGKAVKIMRKCDSDFVSGGCTGHLGKFDSCRDEALWNMALDEGGGTGDTDFEGYATLVIVEKDADQALPDYPPTGPDMVVRVPAGNYIVWTATSGTVSVSEHSPREAAESVFEVHRDRYDAWDHGCDPNNRAAHEECLMEHDSCQLAWSS